MRARTAAQETHVSTGMLMPELTRFLNMPAMREDVRLPGLIYWAVAVYARALPSRKLEAAAHAHINVGT